MDRLCFLNQRMNVVIVCKKQHKKKSCSKPHSVPADAIWCGMVPKDLHGELVVEARRQRKRWKLTVARWERKRIRLANHSVAPAFTSFKTKLIADHDAAKPKPAFDFDTESLKV